MPCKVCHIMHDLRLKVPGQSLCRCGDYVQYLRTVHSVAEHCQAPQLLQLLGLHECGVVVRLYATGVP
jgi:hypothetical protein